MVTTLKELQNQTPFEGWRGFADGEALEDSEALYADTVQQLLDLGAEPPCVRCLEILAQYIEAFNVLDEKYDGFIETIERETICDTVSDMARACNIPDVGCDDVPGEGRNW